MDMLYRLATQQPIGPTLTMVGWADTHHLDDTTLVYSSVVSD